MYYIKNLKYRKVLNIPELKINQGNLCVISGPSGCGKSSLINLLIANDYKYQGEIYYQDMLLKDIDSMKIKKDVVTLGQESILLGKTIKEDFKELCQLLNIEYIPKKIGEVLKIAELDLALSMKTSRMSGGQKQRLYIARILYLERKVYILDEPTSALDSKTSEMVMNNIYEFTKSNDKLCIIISHDPKVIGDKRYQHIVLGGQND